MVYVQSRVRAEQDVHRINLARSALQSGEYVVEGALASNDIVLGIRIVVGEQPKQESSHRGVCPVCGARCAICEDDGGWRHARVGGGLAHAAIVGF